jgi:D-glycero-D-manno-heptose 1,7-bisphosphate phosphatase
VNGTPSRPPISWVFLDRDGTINVPPPQGKYITSADQVELLPDAARAIRILNEAGVWAAVVTNQRGIALGEMNERDLDAVHARLSDELAREGARLDAIYHCPHDESSCSCRKPQAGMLLSAQRRHPHLDFAQAAMVGDTEADVRAGRKVGASTVLLGADRAAAGCHADHVTGTLLEAVAWLGSELALAPAAPYARTTGGVHRHEPLCLGGTLLDVARDPL